MLTQSRHTRIQFLQLCDGVLFALALAAAYWLRQGLSAVDSLDFFPLQPFWDYLWLLPTAGVLGALWLKSQDFYSTRQTTPGRKPSAFGAAVRATAFTAFTLIVILFFTRMQYARSVIVMGCALGGILAGLRHLLSHKLGSSRLAREQWRQRVLWVGTPAQNAVIRASLSPEEINDIVDAGEFNPHEQSHAALAELLHEHAISTIVLDPNGLEPSTLLYPILNLCAREGVSVVVRTSLFPQFQSGPELDKLGTETVIHYRAHPVPRWHLVIKRISDVVASVIGLLLISPFLLVIALMIKITSRGPVLFRQTRAGVNGRPFEMLKFRTMRVGAENEQSDFVDKNEMKGPVFKLADDPRVIPGGHFLRKHGLDELPQLWNVLRGEMSIVGPRPLPVYEVKRFDNDAHRRRQTVRPGLTCIWQVSGRNDIIDFDEWVRLDLVYIDNWSLWLDLKIIAATIPVVLFGKGGR